MAEIVDYSALNIGDVICEHDTFFRVTEEPKSWKRRDVTVWSVTTVAITEPARVLYPFVRVPGDEWVLQGSGFAAQTVLHKRAFAGVRRMLYSGVDGNGVFVQRWARVLNGTEYHFVRVEDTSRNAYVEVFKGATQVHLWRFKAKGPKQGIQAVSEQLGKLIRF